MDLYNFVSSAISDLQRLVQLRDDALLSANRVAQTSEFAGLQAKWSYLRGFSGIQVNSTFGMDAAINEFLRELHANIFAMLSNLNVIKAAGYGGVNVMDFVGAGQGSLTPAVFTASERLRDAWQLVRAAFPSVSDPVVDRVGVNVIGRLLDDVYEFAASFNPERTVNGPDDISSKCLTQGVPLRIRPVFAPLHVVGDNFTPGAAGVQHSSFRAIAAGGGANNIVVPLDVSIRGSTVTGVVDVRRIWDANGGGAFFTSGLQVTDVEVLNGAGAVISTGTIDVKVDSVHWSVFVPTAGVSVRFVRGGNPGFYTQVTAVEEGYSNQIQVWDDAVPATRIVGPRARMSDIVGGISPACVDSVVSDRAWDILSFIKLAVREMNLGVWVQDRIGGAMSRINPGIVRASNQWEQLVSATSWLTGFALGSTNATAYTGTIEDVYAAWYQMCLDIMYLASANKRLSDLLQSERQTTY